MEALFFTDKQQVYKVRLNELEDGKVARWHLPAGPSGNG